MTVVREAPSHSAIADDDDIGNEGKCTSFPTITCAHTIFRIAL